MRDKLILKEDKKNILFFLLIASVIFFYLTYILIFESLSVTEFVVLASILGISIITIIMLIVSIIRDRSKIIPQS